MRARPVPPLTFDELLARVRELSTGHRGHILDGEVYVDDPPAPMRAHTLAEIAATVVAGSPLGDPVPAGWTFLTNAELSCRPDALLVADVAGFRLSKHDLAEAAMPIPVAPQWICEVLGGATRAFTLTKKRRAYAEMGVEHLWIADPEARVLEAFHNVRGQWVLQAAVSDEPSLTVPPFENFRFDTSDLWTPVPSTRPGKADRAAPSRRRG